MKTRLLRFFLYTVLFALIPFLVSCFLYAASPNLSFSDIRLSPELLVFCIALNAVGHAALYEVGDRGKEDVLIESLRGGYVFGLVCSAILYGAHAYARDVNGERGAFIFVVFWCSVVLAVISFALALWTEILLEKSKNLRK